jgi:hypothetical protein
METMLHFLMILLLIGPIVLALWGYFKCMNIPMTQSESNWKVLPTIINSSVLYALAYNVIYFIQELFLALGKQWIGLKAYLYHNNHNWVGEDPRDDLMQGLGALVIFFLGILLLFLFFRMRKSAHWTNLFVLWLAYNGLNQSLPQITTVPIDRRSDMGQAITYLQLGDTMDYLLSYVSVIAIIALAYGFSKWFMQFTPAHISLNHGFKRFRALFYIVLLPGILGTIILFPYRIMPIDRYQMTVLFLIICVPATFAFSWMVKGVKSVDNEVNQKILLTPIMLSILVLLFFQLVLAPGVVFE